MEDKIRGMFVGMVLGDALGAPHELKSNCKNVYTGRMELQNRHYNRFTKTEYLHPVGSATDDTEMMLCLLRSIVNGDDNALPEYLTWGASGCRSMGTNTRAMLGGTSGKELGQRAYGNRVAKMMKLPEDKQSKGNGTLMRACPLAIIDGDWKQASTEDVILTNNNKVNIDANLAYVGLLRSTLYGTHNEVDESKLCEDVQNALDLSKTPNYLRLATGKYKGYVLVALHLTWKVANSENITYMDAMDWIIGDIGGDTDTNAAIMGAYIGARDGFKKLMEDDVVRENYEVMLKCDNDRPYEYTINELLDILNVKYNV